MTLLTEGAAHFGIELSQGHLDLIRIYLNELWDWNQRMNLTGLSSRKRIAIELFLDSLIPAPHLPKSGKMLDAGSGAGFPGLPLKIVIPHLEMRLLESNGKKVSFLKHVIRLLKLSGVEAVKARIEKIRNTGAVEAYNIITARALAPLGRTVAWCGPLLQPGGFLVCFLGADSQETIEKAEDVLERHRLTFDKAIPYVLPGKKRERRALFLKKWA
jgi:16S rRNA (guanine527-N7)-methyltransferase